MKFYTYILFIVILILLSGCHKRISPPPAPSLPEAKIIQDIKFFPQNLEVYAKLIGSEKLLLSTREQQNLVQKFIDIYFGPWHMHRPSIRKGEISSLFNYPRGYKIGDTKWTREEWVRMRDNANLQNFPSLILPCIITKNTDLRELPTHEYRFSEPTPDPRLNPFDYFQYSNLPVGMPALIAHISKDQRWYYIECPIAGGWVDANDVAFVDGEFKANWQKGNYIALIKDKVKCLSSDKENILLNIGTILPLISENGTNQNYTVLLPKKNSSGYAITVNSEISVKDCSKWPMPLTPGNIAKVGNEMMGQNYGWGGMFGDRDCSALVRDLFTPFGIWLPRNSGAQAKRGYMISLAGLSPSEKQNKIISEGIPFFSLVGMKGHICLYVGEYKGKAVIFHNVWGVRVIENGNNDARFVIGKAVVTSLMPGMELKNLYLPKTFIDRLRSITIMK